MALSLQKNKPNQSQFQARALEILAFHVYPAKKKHICVTVERQPDHTAFASAKLLLKYDGELDPVEVVFVAPPLIPAGSVDRTPK